MKMLPIVIGVAILTVWHKLQILYLNEGTPLDAINGTEGDQ